MVQRGVGDIDEGFGVIEAQRSVHDGIVDPVERAAQGPADVEAAVDRAAVGAGGGGGPGDGAHPVHPIGRSPGLQFGEHVGFGGLHETPQRGQPTDRVEQFLIGTQPHIGTGELPPGLAERHRIEHVFIIPAG